jgi:hypothetical protein
MRKKYKLIYKKDYFGFVYQWINIENGKKYIGGHFGSLTDGYASSSKILNMERKRNKRIFIREILEFVEIDSIEAVQKAEQRWLDSIEDITFNSEYYNINPNTRGGSNHRHLTDEARKQLYDKCARASKQKLKNMTDEELFNLAQRKRKTWNKHSDEEKIIYSKKVSDRRNEEELNMTDKERNKRHLRDCEKIKRIKEDTPEKWQKWQKNLSEAVSEWHKNMSPEKKETIAKSISTTKLLLKLKYITLDSTGQNKQVPFVELQKWLDNGWRLGMTKKKRSKRIV